MSATTEAPARTKTQYIVLTHVQATESTNEAWAPVDGGNAFEGNTDVEAIKAAAEKLGVDEGVFVAVPARSFKVRTIAVQTRKSVTIS